MKPAAMIMIGLCVLAAAVAWRPSLAQTTTHIPEPVNRYQIQHGDSAVWVLDTRSGEVWLVTLDEQWRSLGQPPAK